MKATVKIFILVLFLLVGVSHAYALENPSKADELMSAGGLENFKQAMDIYVGLADQEPANFEYSWKAAKAIWKYGFETEKLDLPDWKDTCKILGKKGMKYAEKAISLGPDKPNAYLYYGRNVGIYADAVSILTALKEGLKDKTQDNLEKAYALDKTFEKGAPIHGLGRYWQLVPWPYMDKDKAMEFYREFQKTEFYKDPANVEVRIYMAEILAEKWGDAPKAEAKALLEEALKMTNDKYWQKKAKDILADL
ncbi:MAG: hypothetical protein WA081_16980 [Desulfosalsimonadaceae bacterium]